MDISGQKFVDFNKWCKRCEYFKNRADKDPCDHCLEEPVNSESTKPINFKEGEKENDRRNNENIK